MYKDQALESYKESEFLKNNINYNFVQDNRSRSQKSFTTSKSSDHKENSFHVHMAKFFDVVADINPRSHTYGQYLAVILSGENNKQLFIPPGYAHGFCVLSNKADIL